MILVTGGARSGKSEFAEKLAKKYKSVLYIATAMPFDLEMENRIHIHQTRRPENWDTLECYLEVPKAVSELTKEYDCILLDCVTLWITNMMFYFGGNDPEKIDYIQTEERILVEVNRLVDCCSKKNILLVTNELGFSLVPENKLGRHFRDIAGKANQLLAEHSTAVYMLVCGIPVKIKDDIS